jgi:hypothetical protein
MQNRQKYNSIAILIQSTIARDFNNILFYIQEGNPIAINMPK